MFPFFSEEAGHKQQDAEATDASTDEASTTAAANPLLNLWSVATAVTNTVKARADELVKSVVDTDWRTELSQFSREVGEESKTLKEKTAELVEHLPEQVVHLPEKAEEALNHLPAQVTLSKDVGQTLEGVGVAFAQLGKTLLQGTKELIDELKDGVDAEIAAATKEGKRAGRAKSAASSSAKLSAVQTKYSRFEAEVAAMQRDSSTYCDEPEDAEDYARWRSGFSLAGVQADIGRITAENAFMAELQSRLVPIIVEHDDFWSRYFYRLHKLQQKEEQRQQLAQRAKTLQEDEVPLGWGDEDEAPPAPSSVQAPKGAAGAMGPSTSSPPPPPPSAAQASPTPEAASPQPQGTIGPEPLAEAAGPEAAAAGAFTPAAVQPRDSRSGSAAALPAAAAAAAAAEAISPSAGSPVPPAAASADANEVSSRPSGGGASSGSQVEHADGESGPHELEPHAETASDSSAREWCVVSSDAKASSGGGAAAAAVEPAAHETVAEVPPLPASSSGGAAGTASPSDTTAGGREAEQAEAAAAPATPAAQPQAAAAVPEAAKSAASPAQPAASAGVAPAKGAQEEDVDEDWGNWD